ncbi:CDGSH iron-sulfur domain-containing protein 2 homolog [Agrilus planipennis]|uniref:CDGSH iron-sulfur domain-containing protein 2 homologue n=1 Tax=Agrilus planipennis TaxID=224129 RepID=A0A1W4WPU7_AGRPL|nr:CDGSH iron-sulfur domain-containing protein 2 homolog [Agrilus planipennis]
MQPFAYLVKEALPNYLTSLPIPDTIGGWFHLGFKDWLALIPPTAFVAGLSYMGYRAFCPEAVKHRTRVNHIIHRSNPKVVDTVDVEDITDKAVFCRCWKSKNWPYCDGSHGSHNKETGDNVGPLVVKKST